MEIARATQSLAVVLSFIAPPINPKFQPHFSPDPPETLTDGLVVGASGFDPEETGGPSSIHGGTSV
jgi:hypothetical protein